MSNNDLDTATAERADKRFATLRAQLAMNGHVLHRTAATDGAVSYYAHKWGMVRHFTDLNAFATFAAQVGGAHHE